MSALDDLILDQSIRRRVGEPGVVTRIDRTGASPLAAFRGVAAAAGGGDIELVTVTDGIPGHFGLRGRDSHTVVFHQRQVEVCAFLYGLTTEDRFEAQLLADVFEGIMLRLVAEFLLQGGHGDQALSTLARSRQVQGGVVLHGPTVEQLADLDRDERYLVEWFFALGHEIGHNLTPDTAQALHGLDWFAPETVEQVVDAILDGRFSADSAAVLKDIIRRGDDGAAPLSHASAAVLRDEAVADLFAVACLSEAWTGFCADATGRAYQPERLLFESLLSMSSVMAIEQCRIMAGWFSDNSSESENQTLMLAGVALQVRMNLLRLVLSDPDVLESLVPRYPSLAAFAGFDDAAFDNAMRFLQSRSQELGAPFDRARKFLSSPEMRDPALLQAYFELVATDETAAFDAADFLRVSRRLDTPMLTALRATVDGAPPPLVTPV
jgi:hypothetical protein